MNGKRMRQVAGKTHKKVALLGACGSVLLSLAGCGGLGNINISGPVPVTPTPITTNAAVTAKNLYVVNGETQTIDVYTANQSGSVTPASSYNAGSPIVAVTGDAAGNLYAGVDDVVTGGHIQVFAAGSATATRTIAIPAVGTIDTNQIATITTDSAGNLYVAANSNEIFVFAPGSSGSAVPVRTIAGAATTLANMTQMAVGSTGELYVAEGAGNAGSVVVKFPAGATGNVAPVTITNSTYLPVGVALDGADNIYISQSDAESFQNGGYTQAIFEFPVGSVAGATPTRSISGSNAGFGFYLQDLQVDSAGNIFVRIYVADVLVFGATATGNVAPSSTLKFAKGDATDSQIYLK